MATKNDENWMMHYNELKAYVAVHFLFKMSHLGDKNNKLAIFTFNFNRPKIRNYHPIHD